MIGLAFAQAAPAAASPAGSPLGGFIPLILIFAVFYFLLIRPQQKKEKERKQMINELKKGDNVITTGGMYGTVVNIRPNTVDLKIDDNVKVQVSKSAVSGLAPQAGEISTDGK
jgi:preprotein translocase subunit YajC